MDKLNAGETWFETEELQVVCTHDAVEVRLPNHTGRLTYALGAAAHWLDERLGGVRPSERVWLLQPDRQSAKIAAGVAQAILSSGDRDPFAVLGEWTARSDEELAALPWPATADAESAAGSAQRAPEERDGARPRFERIGGEPTDPGADADNAEATRTPAAHAEAESEAPEDSAPADDAPQGPRPAGRRRFERIGVRDNTPPAEDAAALPDATAPGDFVLHLVHSGPTPARTASLLSAVSGMPDAAAAALVAEAPAALPGTYDAPGVRKIAVAVSAASGARFRAEPA